MVLADPAAEGLAAMLHALLSAAVEDPARARLLDGTRGTVTITVPDAEVTVGLRFANGTCTVHGGAIARSDLSVRMPSDALLGLSTVPLLLGLPSPLTTEGRAFTKRMLTGEVRIGGIWHVGLLTRLNRLLSVADS